MWSFGCILTELYTGEMFFPTHENNEHLALMEKARGLFPYWMAHDSKYEQFRDCFDLKNITYDSSLKDSDKDKHVNGYVKMKWP